MAEDDDDEAFGGFASAQPNSQFDDEWGDFVKSPQQSKSSEPEPDNTWIKRGGALPLSIFGEEEEGVDDFATGDSNRSGISGDSRTADLYNIYLPDDRPGSKFTRTGDSSSGQNADRSAVTVSVDTVGIRDCESKIGNEEFSFKPPNENGSFFGGWMQEFPGLSSNLKATTPSSDLYTNGQGQQPDNSSTAVINFGGENGWDFKDAFSDFETEDNNKEKSAYSPGNESGSKEALDLLATTNGSINLFAISTESVDYVATTSSISSMFQEMDFIGIQPANDSISKTNSFFEQNNTKDPLNHITYDESEEFDDDFGDFTAASAEIGSKPGDFSANGVPYANDALLTPNGKMQVDLMAHEVSERNTCSFRNGSSSTKSLNLFETSNGSMSFFPLSTPIDYFATSSGIPRASQEDDLIGVQSRVVATGNDFMSHTNSVIEQDNIRVPVNHSTDVGAADFDEDFGEFTAASAETGPQPGEKDTEVNYLKPATPLTISDNDQPESAGSLDVPDLFMHQSTSDQRNSNTPNRVISVNDLISSLYSQAEQTSFINKPAITQLIRSDAVSSFINHDDHLDGSSWSFKDASQKRVDMEASLCSSEDTFSNLKLNNYLDFYSRLKKELCFVIKCQFERLQQTQGSPALSGEDAADSFHDSEFQLAQKELEKMNVFCEENNQQDCHSGDIYLSGFVQTLLEPQFQILESEYHLSEQLLLAEKDLRAAMELIRHTTIMLTILTIGTMEKQRAYISLWSKMISACLQELRHGAFIWNQGMKKHVQSQLLCETQGRKFFWAIGEIYRVVVVLGASVKLFKPWTLSGSVDSTAIYILLEECHAVWSSSGLEEALSTVSAPSALDDTSLLESIKHILYLDELKLQKYVFAEMESKCQLSILTGGVAPGMKMITWGNDQCFVTLANLWANLISREPPILPVLNGLPDLEK